MDLILEFDTQILKQILEVDLNEFLLEYKTNQSVKTTEELEGENIKEEPVPVTTLSLPNFEKSTRLSIEEFLNFLKRRKHSDISKRKDSLSTNVKIFFKIVSRSNLESRESLGPIEKPLSSCSVNSSIWLMFKQKLETVLPDVCEQIIKENKLPTIQYNKKRDVTLQFLLRQPSYYKLNKQITKNNPTDTRIRSLECILSSEECILTDSIEPELVTNIGIGLKDKVNKIFVLSLMAYDKLVSSFCVYHFTSMFSFVIDSLSYYYYLQIYLFSLVDHRAKSIEFDQVHYRMFNLLKLLLKMFKLMAQNWSWYDVEATLNKFINFLCMGFRTEVIDSNILTPMDALSVVDPESTWSMFMIYSGPIRKVMIKSFMKNPIYLEYLLTIVFRWVYEPFIPKIQERENIFQKKDIEFAKFCNSLNTIVNIFQYKTSSCLFPIMQKEICMMRLENVVDISLALIYGLKDSEQKKKIIYSSNFIKYFGQKLSLLIHTESHFFMVFEELLDSIDRNQESMKYLDLFLGILNCGKINPSAIPKTQCSYVSDMGRMRYGKGKSIQFQEVKKCNELFYKAQNNFIKLLINIIRKDCGDINKLMIVIEPSLYLFKLCENVYYFQDNRIELFHSLTQLYDGLIKINYSQNMCKGLHFCELIRNLIQLICSFIQEPLIVLQLSHSDVTLLGSVLLELIQTPKSCWQSSFVQLPLFILSPLPDFLHSVSKNHQHLRNELCDFWTLSEIDTDDDSTLDNRIKQILSSVMSIGHSLEGVKTVVSTAADDSSSTVTEWKLLKPTDIYELLCYSLFNNDHFEHHVLTLALTSLQILVGEMDASLYLENKWNYLEHLMNIQSENVNAENGKVIIDEFTILRQEIIEMSFRAQILKEKQLYLMHTSVNHVPALKAWPKGNDELLLFLLKSKECMHDSNWIKYLRKLYRKKGCTVVTCQLLIVLLDEMIKAQLISVYDRNEISVTNDAEKIELCAEDILGIHQTIRYGLENEVLSHSEQNVERFAFILKCLHNHCDLKNQSFIGFDWFVATIYLIRSECVKQTIECLSLLSYTPFASYIWYYNKKKTALIPKFWHIFDFLVACELPAVHNAFKISGVCCWRICQKWAKECFWRIMDWTQICQWLIFAIIYPVDYQLYFFVSLLKDYEDTILRLVQEKTIWKLLTIPQKQFQISNHFTYMDSLYKRHHTMIYSILTEKKPGL